VLRFGMDQVVDGLHNTVHGVEPSTFDKAWRVGQGAVQHSDQLPFSNHLM
jgi:hypothetical protein